MRKIAVAKRKVQPKLTAAGYQGATRQIVPAKAFRKDVPNGNAEGFLFPALYDFTQRTTAKALVAKQLGAFREAWSQVDLRKARAKNLTPYDVLIIASMVERETIAPEERRLVVGGDLEPAQEPDAAPDRRDHPLRAERAGHRGADAVAARLRQSLQHAEPHRACRRRRSRTRASPR